MDIEEGYDDQEVGDSESEEEKVAQKSKQRNHQNRESDDDIARGLQLYEQTRQKQKAAKEVQKEQRRQERQIKKKPAFLEVQDN